MTPELAAIKSEPKADEIKELKSRLTMLEDKYKAHLFWHR